MRCNPHPALRATLSQREKGGIEELGMFTFGGWRVEGLALGKAGEGRIDSRKERKEGEELGMKMQGE